MKQLACPRLTATFTAQPNLKSSFLSRLFLLDLRESIINHHHDGEGLSELLVPDGEGERRRKLRRAAGRRSGCGDAVALTVWKKSLLLNCRGFTVFDGNGDLVFRVDSYVAGSRGEIVLMDAAGKPLLTIRRKRLSLQGDTWLVFDGEQTVDPRFSVRRQVNFRNTKALAQVSSGGTTSSSSSSSPNPNPSPRRNVVYEIEGSYTQRSVSVYDTSRRCVAEIQQKEAAGGVALGFDVFRLIVYRPYIETPVAMALVILLDQMFGSSSSSSSSAKRL